MKLALVIFAVVNAAITIEAIPAAADNSVVVYNKDPYSSAEFVSTAELRNYNQNVDTHPTAVRHENRLMAVQVKDEESDNDITNCPPNWFNPRMVNGSIVCECGCDHGDIVKCMNSSFQLFLQVCYCMSYSEYANATVVGPCLYACFKQSPHYPLQSNVSDPSRDLCDIFNRDGQLCGKCKDGFAPSVYSYDLSCVNCSDYENNWIKYIGVAFLPLTLFYIIVITLRVSGTSAPMNAFVLVCQMIATPVYLNSLSVHHHYHYHTQIFDSGNKHFGLLLLFSVVLPLYGIWNLDFFRLLYPPFCLHPRMTTLQALALDYAIAVYPLVLIVLSYILVELHDRFELLVRLWRPFHWCFARLRRQWNIRASLIDAFATFLLLSYVKLLSVSYYLLAPVQLFDKYGEVLNKRYLYFDATVEYFGKEHIPYGVLSLFILLFFVIFPVVLLCVYPCRRFQRCLNSRNLRCQALHCFMDAFQGCYKDGTGGTRDCRWFSAAYLVVRIALFSAAAISNGDFVVPVLIFILLIFVFLIAAFQPHKSPAYNISDIFLVLVFVAHYTSALGNIVAYSKAYAFRKTATVITGMCVILPLLYIAAFLLFWLCGQRKLPGRNLRKLRCILSFRNFIERRDYDEALPDRMLHSDDSADTDSDAFTDDQHHSETSDY